MIVTPIARRLKRLRTERRVTIRDLAAALGKSAAYLAKIEVQGEIPTPELTSAIARVLETDPLQLLELAKETRLSNVTRDIEREYAQAITSRVPAKSDSTVKPQNNRGEYRMTKVLSLINMKGGVGKTTLAMQLAHTAASNNMRTLAVDLDPQSNLSQALMGPRAYVQHLAEKKPSVVQIFDEYVPSDARNGSPRLLDIADIVVKGVGQGASSMLRSNSKPVGAFPHAEKSPRKGAPAREGAGANPQKVRSYHNRLCSDGVRADRRCIFREPLHYCPN